MPDTFYITTSIAYVNAKPHIGFAMEVIQADVLARYHRLKGKEVFYLTGTDEHGMKLQQTAKDFGLTPKELVDQNSAFFRELRDILNLSYDRFIRTTDDDHFKGAQKLWTKMMEAGDLYKSSYEGLYCIGCEAFITEKDLVDGKCPNHNREPEKLKEENYFFRLSKYSKQIQELIQTDQLKIVPDSRKHEILSVLEEGLKDVSFSRPKKVLDWGIEVPNDPDQVMYVWCDALSNYITGVGYGSNENLFEKFWPANVHLIGKDILRFHSAIWIGMLLSAKLPLPKSIDVHGFITSEGKKMSKSLNNVVDPFELVKKYGTDPVRYYLLREIPTTDDGDFSQERFQVLYSSELANTFGNLVSRVFAMTQKYFAGKIPSSHFNSLLEEKINQVWNEHENAIEKFDLKAALEAVIGFANFANEYVELSKPWALSKEGNQEKLAEVIYQLLEMIHQIALMLLPFLPSTSEKILAGFKIDLENISLEAQKRSDKLRSGETLESLPILFPRLEA